MLRATTATTGWRRSRLTGGGRWAESVSETRLVVCRAGAAPEIKDCPAANHLGQNLEAFAAAALGRGAFPIDAAGILQTASALDAVFRSVEADGAWQAV